MNRLSIILVFSLATLGLSGCRKEEPIAEAKPSSPQIDDYNGKVLAGEIQTYRTWSDSEFHASLCLYSHPGGYAPVGATLLEINNSTFTATNWGSHLPGAFIVKGVLGANSLNIVSITQAISKDPNPMPKKLKWASPETINTLHSVKFHSASLKEKPENFVNGAARDSSPDDFFREFALDNRLSSSPTPFVVALLQLDPMNDLLAGPYFLLRDSDCLSFRNDMVKYKRDFALP